MAISVRDLLEELAPASTKRLCGLRGLPAGGNQQTRVTSLARSFRGDHAALLEALHRYELVKVLEPDWFTESDQWFRFTYIGGATDAQLRVLAEKFFIEDWEPTEDGQRPVRSAPIEVCFLDDESDDDDETDDGPDGSDDDLEPDDSDDSDARDFSGPEYAAELEADFRYAPRHEGEKRDYQGKATAALLAKIDAAAPQLLHIATGGGKTRIANDVVNRFLDESGGPILWVTKDWRLLWQAARDRCRRTPGAFDRIGRIGGDFRILHPLPDNRKASVFYTTLQTLGRGDRLRRLRRHGSRPTLVLWDECHWGEHAKLGRRLIKWCKEQNIPVIGLTATPRPPIDSAFRVTYSADYRKLVDLGFLASANLVDPIRTNARWEPRRSNSFSDFQQDSLRELGENRKRNDLIVEHYRNNSDRYGQTIVFACTINHANRLEALLNREHGIAARAVHSERSESENDEAIRHFETGAVRVLVNVAKLTMGHDFPSARTIFICRPTLSEILFAQMIGRAARLHAASGKREFHVVEFTDNLSKFADQLVTAKTYFKGAPSRQGQGDRPTPSNPAPEAPPKRHAFDLRGAATWLPDDSTVPEPLRGLWYRQGQTFGIELELTSEDFDPEMATSAWLPRAEALRKQLAETLGAGAVASKPLPEHGDENKDHSVWNVEWDASAGWEVTSRVLRGQAGYLEIDRACAVIARAAESLSLRVNALTGLHIHLGWLGRTVDEVKRAISLARLFEPALGTLVSPSRIAAFDGHRYELGRPNEYCRPISSVISARRLDAIATFDDLWAATRAHEARYVSFNIKPLDDIQTVEVRLFNGTTEARKILLWLSLWQQILWAASNATEIPEVPDCDIILPSGDILDLARRHLPPDHGKMLASLQARRLEIRRLWEKRPEFSDWLKWSGNWAASLPDATPTQQSMLYFAYGANMSTEIMTARCHGARAVGVGKLRNYRLAFAGASTRWGGAVATVTRSDGAEVSGVLYEVPPADLDALDQVEGRNYARIAVTVDTPAGERSGHTYAMSGDAPAGPPPKEYLRILRAEYSRLGFNVVDLLDAITA